MEIAVRNMLIRKLESFCPFDPDDSALLTSIVVDPRTIGAHEDIIREGAAPKDVHLIVEGLACRYKILPDGSRQIFAYLVPGDFCDLHVFILEEMDHCIGTLAACKVVDIPRDAILRLMDRPAIARALWWATLVDEGTLREGLVNLGRRNAEERIGHFLCELLVRFELVGLVHHGSYELPITQAEFGDTMGLSTVHINRVLQQLRGQKLIAFGKGSVTVLDVDRLKRFSGFNPNYLHLGRHRAEADRTNPRRPGRSGEPGDLILQG